MKIMKSMVIFTLGAMLGFGVAVTAYKLHINRTNFTQKFAEKALHLKDHMAFALDRAFSSSKVRAARAEHVVAPAAYFPPGSIWTQDISHAPLSPSPQR